MSAGCSLWLNGWRCRVLFDPNWPYCRPPNFPVKVSALRLASLPEWDNMAEEATAALLAHDHVTLTILPDHCSGPEYGGYWVAATPVKQLVEV